MDSLQEQIDFMQKEHDRCKLVYNFLLREFGQKHIHHFDKEISEKIDFSRAIVKSLQNLQFIRNEKDH